MSDPLKDSKVILWPLWLIVVVPLLIGLAIKLIRYGLD